MLQGKLATKDNETGRLAMADSAFELSKKRVALEHQVWRLGPIGAMQHAGLVPCFPRAIT